jgi:hypothetical protein
MTLREAILAVSASLDPDRQSECWPDPIAWDGRPLLEQARDLLARADAECHPDAVDATTGRYLTMLIATDELRAALAVEEVA